MAANKSSDVPSPVQPGLQSPTATPSSPDAARVPSVRICAICLGSMELGCGRTLFTAECSHVFHFDCISSSVNHGNQGCPVCRSKWKQLPCQDPAADVQGRSRFTRSSGRQRSGWTRLLDHLFPGRRVNNEPNPTRFYDRYNDDEPLDFSLPEFVGRVHMDGKHDLTKKVEMETHVERLAVSASECHESFSVLIHLKAPLASSVHKQASCNLDHVPVDLVTVLDVSGSMEGTKLSLLKQAMGFVIQNLGTSDRLSVVSFSSNAHRLFPLHRMTDSGRLQALQDVDSLSAGGTTNIAAGLKKGGKVLEERRYKNAVCGIILLSDGLDSHIYTAAGRATELIAQDMLPFSIRHGSQQGQARIPVHAFGIGTDHDAALMHSISESSGGTFSFIEAGDVVQDAFARCIGGLLSVVVQNLQVQCECVSRGVNINSIHAGSYASQISDHGHRGIVDVGEMYAEEERDFLLDMKIPASSIGELVVLKVGCVYKDVVLQQTVNVDIKEVIIQRPRNVNSQQNTVSIQVDRQKNRLKAANAMARSHELAERGNLEGAVAVLHNQRKALLESAAAQAGDQLTKALDTELKEMQDRLASRQEYETSGRAQVLSGLSTHSRQRAATRHSGPALQDFNDLYGTTSMSSMVTRSRASQNSIE